MCTSTSWCHKKLKAWITECPFQILTWHFHQGSGFIGPRYIILIERNSWITFPKNARKLEYGKPKTPRALCILWSTASTSWGCHSSRALCMLRLFSCVVFTLFFDPPVFITIICVKCCTIEDCVNFGCCNHIFVSRN